MLDSHLVENQLLEFELQAARSLADRTKRSCAAEKELLRSAEVPMFTLGLWNFLKPVNIFSSLNEILCGCL